jgi:hypothetical protein
MVVRLYHTHQFQQDQFWRCIADFKTNSTCSEKQPAAHCNENATPDATNGAQDTGDAKGYVRAYFSDRVGAPAIAAATLSRKVFYTGFLY